MTSIRPGLPPPVQPSTPRTAETGRSAAQRAFFEIAAGKAAAVRTAPQVAPSPPAAPTASLREAPASTMTAPAGRLPRPGSLLDIKV